MTLKTLRDADLENKLVLYRAPYDIEPELVSGELTLKDLSRIEATLPTLLYLLQKNCRIAILTWVGRPDGKVVESLRTSLHAEALSKLLNRPVNHLSDCVGPSVTSALSSLQQGSLLMLENVRFHPSEEPDDDSFATELASGYDLCVFDAFPQSHRIHASTTGLERHLDSFAGLYLESEYTHLSSLINSPAHPFTVIIGGAKISDKVEAVKNLMNLADNFLIGGAIANIFLKARGFNMGASYIEEVSVQENHQDWVSFAKELLATHPDKIHLPIDLVITDNLKNPKESQTISTANAIPDTWAAVDIGPETVKHFATFIASSQTIFWNGPLGLVSNNSFVTGSKEVLLAIAGTQATKIIAGGDTIPLVNEYSTPENFTYLSLAGGATLEFLSGHPLPALQPLLK